MVGGDAGTRGIGFNLLVIIKHQSCKLSDQLELLKGEWDTFEWYLPKRLGQYGWSFSLLNPSNALDTLCSMLG